MTTVKATTVEMPDLSLVVVRADHDRGPEIKAAWQTLEARLPSLKGRRFYGVCCKEESGTVYYAGVEPLNAEEIQRLGLPTLLLKGGKYVRAHLTDWPNQIDRIGAILDDLQRSFPTDPDRPVVEHYRSQSDLYLLAPLISHER